MWDKMFMARKKSKHPFEGAHSIGPKMVQYLSMIGVTDFDDLIDVEAEDLAMRIDVEFGRKTMNALGRRALENLVNFAKEQRNG